MRIDVLTLFPEMFGPVLGSSILKRAAEAGRVSYHLTNIRDYTQNKHGKVDDRPYGGGPGMVMACQPLWDAVRTVEAEGAHAEPTVPSGTPEPGRGGDGAAGVAGEATGEGPTRILLCPGGERLTQQRVEWLAERDRLLLIAGHYEGIDQRVIDELDPLPISIGDYVLSGGELAAMVLIDAVVRLIPGVLGHDQSAHEDSFSPGAGRLLDHPHYTRPPEWMGRPMPDVLLSGDHAAIERWRRARSEERTRRRRPDLLKEDPAGGKTQADGAANIPARPEDGPSSGEA